MLRSGTDDVPVGVDRLIQLVEAKLIHLPQAILELEYLVWGLADFSLACQDIDQLPPSLGLDKQTIQGPHRALVYRVHLQHLPVSGHGIVYVLNLHLVDLGNSQAQLYEPIGIISQLLQLGVVQLGHCRPPFQNHSEALK